MNEIILAIVALVGGFVGGSGFKTLVDFLTKRKEIEAQSIKAVKDEQEKRDQSIVQFHSEAVIGLRKELHDTREQAHGKYMEYERRLTELATQHQDCLRDNARLERRLILQEAANQQLQERVAVLSTGGGTAQVTVDEDEIVRVWNQDASDIFGWTPGEAIGKHVSFLIPEEYKEAHKTAFARWLEQDRPPRNQSLVFRGVNKWGEAFPVDVSLTGWKDAAGKWHVTATMRKRHERFD
jgi:PAS domain S-box-containing protein